MTSKTLATLSKDPTLNFGRNGQRSKVILARFTNARLKNSPPESSLVPAEGGEVAEGADRALVGQTSIQPRLCSPQVCSGRLQVSGPALAHWAEHSPPHLIVAESCLNDVMLWLDVQVRSVTGLAWQSMGTVLPSDGTVRQPRCWLLASAAP